MQLQSLGGGIDIERLSGKTLLWILDEAQHVLDPGGDVHELPEGLDELLPVLDPGGDDHELPEGLVELLPVLDPGGDVHELPEGSEVPLETVQVCPTTPLNSSSRRTRFFKENKTTYTFFTVKENKILMFSIRKSNICFFL